MQYGQIQFATWPGRSSLWEAGSQEGTTRAALRQLLSSQREHTVTQTASSRERAKQIGTNIIFNSDKYIFQFSNQSGHTQLAHSGERAKQVQPVQGCICTQERSEKTQERSEKTQERSEKTPCICMFSFTVFNHLCKEVEKVGESVQKQS